MMLQIEVWHRKDNDINEELNKKFAFWEIDSRRQFFKG